MTEKNVRKRIKAIKKEIDKRRHEISKTELLPCHNDKDLREKEENIIKLWNLVKDLEKKKDNLMLIAMGFRNHQDEISSVENDTVFEEKITIVNGNRDNRGQNRYNFETPGSVTVEFRIEKGSKKYRVRKANVIDISEHGFAILVPPKSDGLLRILRVGDKVQHIAFFGLRARTKKNGIIRHETKIRDGKYKDCYIIGIEVSDF